MAILTAVVAVVAGVVAGAYVALRYIAPKTPTKLDDKARDLLAKAVPYLPDELKAVVEKAIADEPETK
jgi:hypothetical protein